MQRDTASPALHEPKEAALQTFRSPKKFASDGFQTPWSRPPPASPRNPKNNQHADGRASRRPENGDSLRFGQQRKAKPRCRENIRCRPRPRAQASRPTAPGSRVRPTARAEPGLVVLPHPSLPTKQYLEEWWWPVRRRYCRLLGFIVLLRAAWGRPPAPACGRRRRTAWYRRRRGFGAERGESAVAGRQQTIVDAEEQLVAAQLDLPLEGLLQQQHRVQDPAEGIGQTRFRRGRLALAAVEQAQSPVGVVDAEDDRSRVR